MCKASGAASITRKVSSLFSFIQKGLTVVYSERAADDLSLFATFTARLSAQCCSISSLMSLCEKVAANINQTQCRTSDGRLTLNLIFLLVFS